MEEEAQEEVGGIEKEEVEECRQRLEVIEYIEHELEKVLETNRLPWMMMMMHSSSSEKEKEEDKKKNKLKRRNNNHKPSYLDKLIRDRGIKHALEEAKTIASSCRISLKKPFKKQKFTTSQFFNDVNNLLQAKNNGHDDDHDDDLKQIAINSYRLHRSNNVVVAENLPDDFQDLIHKDESMLQTLSSILDFSGEEKFGRLLDLQSFYTRFLNFERVHKDAEPLSYSTFLTNVGDSSLLTIKAKLSAEYQRYLSDLKLYLCRFYEKIHPLEVMTHFDRNEFEKKWAQRQIIAWKDYYQNQLITPKSSSSTLLMHSEVTVSEAVSTIDFSNVKTSKELEKYGLESLKLALKERGLKCSGTLQERAQRLFSIKDLDPANYPKSILATSNAKHEKHEEHDNNKRKDERAHATALLECEIQIILLNDLADRLSATQNFAIKKLTSTYEEIEAEFRDIDDVHEEDLEVDDEAEAKIANPLNIPLGWDGKPLPYWLYKLHGLGIKYSCEICGGYTYDGLQNFERHFQERRHAAGMQKLGIPNTRHFQDIVSIDVAKALHLKLMKQLKESQFQQDFQAEVEDSEGNVMTKDVYDDLVRNGILS